MKKLLWFLLAVLMLILNYQDSVLQQLSKHGIVEIEFSHAQHGKEILCTWERIKYGDGTLINTVRNNTHIDFLFIVIYTSLLLLYSYLQMQREKWLFLNELLRLNLLLAFLAGLLDIAENIFLLYDFRHVNDIGLYWSSYWLALPKWMLIGWIIFVWLASFINTAISSSIQPKTMRMPNQTSMVN